MPAPLDLNADLNDMVRYARVVEYGGFAPAARALGVQASGLSRAIQGLEDRLGVRLLNRSTRHVSTTEVGQSFYRHCQQVIAAASAALESVEASRTRPQGLVRITCPPAMLRGMLGDVIDRYLSQHPLVRIHAEASSEIVDLVANGIDVAVRVSQPPLVDSDLVVRPLAEFRLMLAASPAFLARHGHPDSLEDIAELATVAMPAPGDRYVWELRDADGRVASLAHQPRLICNDLELLRKAALSGHGIALMPEPLIEDDLLAGRLEALLPHLGVQQGILYAVFASGRGLVPAVRGFIDTLVTEFARLATERRAES